MNATTQTPTPASGKKADLTNTFVLAELLERLDHSATPVDAGQYRIVAEHLASEFSEVVQGTELRALLDTHPAAAELYENLNYQYAGLCRSALDASLATEKLAKQAIAAAMRQDLHRSTTQPKEDPQHGKS
ncbi:MAG: hypothetical protein V4573_19550 [Pseudomonadota bacterium]